MARHSVSREPLVVVKFGGELVDSEDGMREVAATVARTLRAPARLVVVHGGGREIDLALQSAGLEKRQVDGLRITDRPTLDIVVGVLAGRINTRLVAALGAAGVRGVGLTGADAGCGLSRKAPLHTAASGGQVDLGLVGEPIELERSGVVDALLAADFVPVVASIGATVDGQLLNVNADTLAAHLAISLRADRLILAGATDGVLDEAGRTIRQIDPTTIETIVATGTATAGMIAKLSAANRAVARGVEEVFVVNGRRPAAVEQAVAGVAPERSTRVAASLQVQVS